MALIALHFLERRVVFSMWVTAGLGGPRSLLQGATLISAFDDSKILSTMPEPCTRALTGGPVASQCQKGNYRKHRLETRNSISDPSGY